MTKTDKKKNERGRVMFYLDQATLDRLDLIVKQEPDIDSRSAAIRYITRLHIEQREKK